MSNRQPSPNTIIVLTKDSVQNIIEANGSGCWRIDADKHASNLRWLIVTHKMGKVRQIVLVGKVTRLQRRPEDGRYSIEISEYAELKGKKIRYESKATYPVQYGDAGEVLGFEPNELSYIIVPKKTRDWSFNEDIQVRPLSLTIAEAKSGLALFLGIDEENIEITIKV